MQVTIHLKEYKNIHSGLTPDMTSVIKIYTHDKYRERKCLFKVFQTLIKFDKKFPCF